MLMLAMKTFAYVQSKNRNEPENRWRKKMLGECPKKIARSKFQLVVKELWMEQRHRELDPAVDVHRKRAEENDTNRVGEKSTRDRVLRSAAAGDRHPDDDADRPLQQERRQKRHERKEDRQKRSACDPPKQNLDDR